MAKSLTVRNATDLRKIGSAHSGSPLMNPISPIQGAVAVDTTKLPSYSFPISSPGVGGRLMLYLQVDKKIIQIKAAALGGGTVSFNVEKRQYAKTAGTDLMVSEMTVDEDEGLVDTFADDALPALYWLYLDISDVTGTVTDFSVTLVTTGGTTLGGPPGAPGAAGADGVDGADGRDVELQNNGTHIQWRAVGDSTWIDLVALTDITDPGDMLKSTYDTDDDGIVDEAASANAIRGVNVDPALAPSNNQVLKYDAGGDKFIASDEAGSNININNLTHINSRKLIAPAGFQTTAPNQNALRNSAIASVVINNIVYEVYVFYDDDGKVCVATRTIPGEWTVYKTAITFGAGGDEHNNVVVGLDPDGYLHICYDMHGEPLLYRKSVNPVTSFDGSLTAVLAMLGTNETYVTYPSFINDPQGNLYFIFRQQGGAMSGGNDYFYKYDHSTETWEATIGSGSEGKIFDGLSDSMWPYFLYPCFDKDFGSGGLMHFFLAPRNDAASTYDFIYYMAWDGTSWYQADGSAQTIPARIGNSDAIETLTGSTYQPTVLRQMIYSDSTRHPHLALFRDDGDLYWHFYHIWYDGSSWIKLALADIPNVPIAQVHQSAIMAIDRDDDTVILVYVDHADGDTFIRALVSEPNDFTVWSKLIVYPYETDLTSAGIYQPKYDVTEWERSHKIIISIEEWAGSGTHPIYSLEYVPRKWSLYNSKEKPDLHANDIDTSAGIHHTLGTDPDQAASGNHTHSFSGGEVLMATGITPPEPLVSSDGYDWVYSS